MKRSAPRAAIAIGAAFFGCAGIAGFEDLRADCPADEPLCADAGSRGGPGGAGGQSGASGSGAGPASVDCDSTAQPPNLRGGPEMAKIVRAPGSCFWIDTTEVTQVQYAAYLATNPAPIDDPRCPGEAPLSMACAAARADSGSPSDLPQTCVDWCQAQAFCLWAGKQLCNDDAGAIGDEQLEASDFYYACSEGGQNEFATDPCPTTVCNVPQAGLGYEIKPAGKTSNCFVQAGGARVYDLIGNVAEWTAECLVENEGGECLTRGGSFAVPACCEDRYQAKRRTTSTSTGFRCCYYAP